MSDVPALPPGLFEFVGRWRPPHPDKVPARIAMHPTAYQRIRMLPANPSAGKFAPPIFHIGPSPENLIGMAVDIDPALEPDVWRVYAADGTLLRDSRSTNEVT
jgi:hypothetical protein